MAYKQYRVETNYGDVLDIVSIHRDEHLVKIGETTDPVTQETQNVTEMQYMSYYDIGLSTTSSVVKIPADLPICAYSISDYLPHYSDPKPAEYYSSDIYKAIKEECDSKAYWVWGSYDDGGMLALRTSSDNVQIAVMEGFYKIDVAGQERYCYNQNYRDLTVQETQNLTINCESNSDGFFWCYSSGKIVSILRPIKNFIGVIDYYEAITSYDNVDLYYWREASQYIGITTQTIGDDMPSYTWQNEPSLINISDNSFPYDRSELIYGNFWGNSSVDDDGNPFVDGGVSGAGGGWGGYPSQSDSIDITNPENFGVDVISSGILTLYKPSATQLADFQRFLFSGITDSISAQLKKLTSDPLQYLLFVAMVHYDPIGNVGDEISYAGVGTGVYSAKVDKQYRQINCGKITIPEASKSFLDYGAFSKVSIYLPYVGVEHLNIDDVMGSTIQVVYNINQLDGSCIVQVKCTRDIRRQGDTRIDSVLYHFNGNCFSTIPMFATDWRGAISSAVSLIGGVGSVATGNVGGGIGALANAVSQEKVTLKRSGSNSTSYGYMDNQKPYLILERPIQNIPLNYGKYEGFTSNMNSKISNLRGYTEIDTEDIYINDFDGITDEEFTELKDILNGGIYL